jgi:hypothetical protein
MIEAVCHVLLKVFNADWGIAMGRGITMMSHFAIAFFFLGLNHCYNLSTRGRTSQSLIENLQKKQSLANDDRRDRG